MVSPSWADSATVFADTSFLIGLFHTKDTHHQSALKLFEKLPEKTLVVVSNLVVYEAVTVMAMRASRARAIALGETLFQWSGRGVLNIQYVDQALEPMVWSAFQSVKKKDVSFADCASAVIAREWGIPQLLTFDRHFKLFAKEFAFTVVGI